MILTVFPEATDEQKEAFDLLKLAYVEARYNPGYKITKDEICGHHTQFGAAISKVSPQSPGSIFIMFLLARPRTGGIGLNVHTDPRPADPT